MLSRKRSNTSQAFVQRTARWTKPLLHSKATTSAGACVALLLAVSPAAAMSFEVIADGGECARRICILATGEIESDTASDFSWFLAREQAPAGSMLILNSPGGDVVQALAMGRKVRKAGLSTMVAGRDLAGAIHRGECASACAYVFLGGVTRTLGDGARLGVHQMFGRYGELSAADSQWLTAMIATHVQSLGGNMDFLITALRTPPQTTHWLSPTELARLGVVRRAFNQRVSERPDPNASVSRSSRFLTQGRGFAAGMAHSAK